MSFLAAVTGNYTHKKTVMTGGMGDIVLPTWFWNCFLEKQTHIIMS